MIFVSRNIPEAGGGTRGFPQTCDRSDGQESEGRYLKKRNSGECTQGRGNTDPGEKS